jgi:purine nucleosidase
MKRLLTCAVVSAALFVLGMLNSQAALEDEPIRLRATPLIIDTDLGSDIDDVFALALALASPELDVRAVTTVGKQAEDRAWMVCRFLSQSGRGKVPVAAGAAPPRSADIDWQIQYRRHPAAIFNRSGRPVKQPAVELIYSLLKANPGEITLVALGPLTNIAELLEKHPDCRPWIKRLIVMGGAVRVGYQGKPPAEPEWNIASDVAAARRVLASGVQLTLVPLDATATVALERHHREEIFAAHTPLSFQVQALYELWDRDTPVLYDPVAVAAAFTDEFCKFEELRLRIDDKGVTRIAAVDKLPSVRVATSIDRERFLSWFVKRLATAGLPALPRPAKNRSMLVDRGGFPAKVHVVEDYDTDIEKRWWMAGKLERADVPDGGRRASRAVPTQDFDDRQGDLQAMYRAVIFNPVPGPPMGPNTRLTFRYKLTGTDQLRVQLYSLSNGYHRYLSLAGLTQGRWESATVDMTQMRRPDGTGGPLAENERIDDIQFYIDPRGELLIDEIILYDAAGPDERRPFPQRIVFTAWFDTGKQGQEWPGDFEIVPHQAPAKWRYARSVVHKETKTPWLRISLRGERRLDAITEVSFRYRLSGTDMVRVELRNSKSGWSAIRVLRDLHRDEWDAATVRFDTPGKGKEEVRIDEVRFLPVAGSELGVDDVLVYTAKEG